ncbi:hypothetical protein [Ruania halotolerans]|uniref:hypothetical protein n=1 Tax=Ruania halotolerans TaxID=2897773 RepID=UPI001E29EBD6|nr:hypothetical protein [Ruania halotolerans]UFU07230.1 hypothetical protein LQF10_03725 [Ruania halotolerans]
MSARTVSTVAFVGAGLGFALFPVLRPWSDAELSTRAETFASTGWVLSHTIGMVAFIALSLALAAAVIADGGPRRRDALTVAAVLAWVGSVLILPYFGAETFGLQALGEHASGDDQWLAAVSEQVRGGIVQTVMFGTGLLAVAVSGVALAVRWWAHGPLPRAAGTLVGLGLVTYLPQFFLSPALRTTHGVVLAIGCLLAAACLTRVVGEREVTRETRASARSAA